MKQVWKLSAFQVIYSKLLALQKVDSSSEEEEEDNDLALAMGFSGFGSTK